MKIKNNKGFTLLEVLVAIFIVSIVVSIGYKIIDKSINIVKEQGNINKGQLTINNMNKYLTKDLEQSKSIKLLLDGIEIVDTNLTEKEATEKGISNLLELGNEKVIKEIEELPINKSIKYKYIISGINDTVEYLIDVNKNNSSTKNCKVSRVDSNGVKIEFISSGVMKKEGIPLSITGDGIYKVSIGYGVNSGKFNEYEFDVSSRF